MCRKALLFGMPLLVALGTLATVMFYERQRTPDWQQTLAAYLHLSQMADDVEVLASVKARTPWDFNAEMGRAVSGELAWPWGIAQLPYPPDALYCVLVGKPESAVTQEAAQPGGKFTLRLLYVAHHSDKMWRVGWLVHEGGRAPWAATDEDVLASVGCEFDPQMAPNP